MNSLMPQEPNDIDVQTRWKQYHQRIDRLTPEKNDLIRRLERHLEKLKDYEPNVAEFWRFHDAAAKLSDLMRANWWKR